MEENTTESYRDRIATVDKSGKRVWIFPKKPSGKYFNARAVVSYVLLIFLFGAPFVKLNGEQLLLIGVLERKFVILGRVFSQYDFYLFVLLMISIIIFITLFTVVWGRIFCGWVCPQTIFMEMVFRRIEYWIEGDYKHQMKLKKSPWTNEKIFKKALKHSIFFFISFLIANCFLAYLVGSDKLISIITDPPSQHVSGLTGILVFSLVFYFVFSKLREQVCTTICPYGRLQGVLLDKHSVVVAYDHKRGEQRGRFKKNENRTETLKGDCIDCHQCVDVCPTGIDIRDGTQLECVNCTACIDACDFMMSNVGLPKGLIRYASEHEINTGQKFRVTLRMKAYSALLLLLMVITTSFLLISNDIETAIIRTPGVLYEKMDDGSYRNLYNFVIHNKTGEDLELEVRPHSEEISDIQFIGDLKIVEARSEIEGALFIYVASDNLPKAKTKLKVGIFNKETGEQLEEVKITFLLPFR
jgi:cytochrome c oxidase accessory protein FixG